MNKELTFATVSEVTRQVGIITLMAPTAPSTETRQPRRPSPLRRTTATWTVALAGVLAGAAVACIAGRPRFRSALTPSSKPDPGSPATPPTEQKPHASPWRLAGALRFITRIVLHLLVATWGVLILVVGVIDAVSANSVPSRIQGALLAIVGGYIVVSLCRLRSLRLPTRDDQRRVLIATLAALLLALYLLYEVSTDFVLQPQLLQVGAICLVSALASMVLAVLRAVGVAKFSRPHVGVASPSRNWREAWISPGATVVAALMSNCQILWIARDSQSSKPLVEGCEVVVGESPV